MSLPQTKTKRLYTVEEYLQMERASEVRHEYLDGYVFLKNEPPVTPDNPVAHARILTNLIALLHARLREKNSSVFTQDINVCSYELTRPQRKTKRSFSNSDVVIVCGTPRTHDEYKDILLNPTVIIEVLSESTELFDRTEKLRRYRAHLETLTDYILVAQDKPLIDIYHKIDAGRWEASWVEGLESELAIDSINCRLRLADVYDRIEFPPATDEDGVEENPFEEGAIEANGNFES